MAEEWRDIPGWAGFQVSSQGRVKSFRRSPDGKLLSQFTNAGYKKVTLQTAANAKQTFRVHRLVCEAFNGPQPSAAHEAAHNDGSRTNNRADNLRWATRKQNIADCARHGTLLTGENNPAAKLTNDQWGQLLGLHRAGEPIRALARQFKLSESSIRERLRRHLSA